MRRTLCVVLGALGTVGAIGCGGDSTGPMPSTNPDLLWSLAFEWPAVNMALAAPYDTVQLTAIPRTVDGAVATDTGTIQYSTLDSAVTVSSTGLVTARFATAGARVVARFTKGGITLTDTALVQVTQSPLAAPLATLSIQPQANGIESARASLDAFYIQIPFFATIASGDPASDTVCFGFNGCNTPLLVHYASSDPSIAVIDQWGVVTPYRAGRVVLTASTLAYGVGKVDSLPFVIGYTARAVRFLEDDSTQNPVHIVLHPPAIVPPYGLGFQLGIENDGGEIVTVTVPGLGHGVHFIDLPDYTDNLPDTAQLVDTIPTCAIDCLSNLVYVQFDSAGTYTIQYHGLTSGVTFEEQYIIKPDP